MARNFKRHDIPAPILNMGEAFQRTFGESKVGRAVIWLATGSSSSAYFQAYWEKQRHIDPSKINTRIVDGDKGASRIPVARAWRTATIFGASAVDLDERVQSSLDKRPAVAYVADGIVRVGVFPEGVNFGVLGPEDDPYYAAGMRVARSALEGTIGFWLPLNKELVTAQRTIIMGKQHHDVKTFAEKFPAVPLA